MELRVLQYFLAVAREQSISAAAETLHLSQPTLSRQLKELEQELGKQLMVRGSRRITLTEEGMLLRKRAEEILDLVHKTETEILDSEETISGSVCIGSGETNAVRLLARAAETMRMGCVNRWMGAGLGAFKYAVLLSMAVYFIEFIDTENDLIPSTKKRASALYYPVKSLSGIFIPAIKDFTKRLTDTDYART